MSNGFHINITFWGWLLELKDHPAPFELIDDEGRHARVDLENFTAHQYACLSAYPGKNKNLAEKSHHHLRTLVSQGYTDDDYDEVNYNEDIGVIAIQIENTRLTWSPSSAIEYLISQAYYSFALKRIEKDASSLWSIPLFLGWSFYRLIDSLRFVGALIFSPVGFSLTFALKNTRDSARLFFTYLHYGFARCVNKAMNYISSETRNIKYYLNSYALRKITVNAKVSKRFKAENLYKQFLRPGEIEKLTRILSEEFDNPLMTPPSLNDARETFKKRFGKNWEASCAYFSPVQQKLEHILVPMLEKAKTSPVWTLASIFTVLSIIASVAFLDFVAVEAFTRAIESRPFGTDFLDKIGGGYAEIAAKHISSWATLSWKYTEIAGQHVSSWAMLSWKHIEIGMQFFIHFIVNKAVVPALNLIPGFDIAHTSAETCRYVGGILFMTLVPVLAAMGIYTNLKPTAPTKRKVEDTLIPSGSVSSDAQNQLTLRKDEPVINTNLDASPKPNNELVINTNLDASPKPNNVSTCSQWWSILFGGKLTAPQERSPGTFVPK